MVKKKILALGLILGWLISAVFASGCVPPEASGGEEGSASVMPTILFGILIIAVMYFILIRPQRKKQKEHEELMSELRKGDRVITTSGIYGQIESLSEESIILKVESGVNIRVTRGSIGTKRAK